MGSTMVWI